jgi:ferredoxin
MITVNSSRCPQNHRCPSVMVCPVEAISQEGFGLPVIDQEKCISCGKCIRFCPMRAIKQS